LAHLPQLCHRSNTSLLSDTGKTATGQNKNPTGQNTVFCSCSQSFTGIFSSTNLIWIGSNIDSSQNKILINLKM